MSGEQRVFLMDGQEDGGVDPDHEAKDEEGGSKHQVFSVVH